ncbi:hypothetical protein O9K51_05799 [Purpureocillium lavendulum]|uniref:Uncharacterized protein n=1 Tax=Purpureocillium lavendulum TaxID=1247861 RepID=A0AB34FW22_9HYPO|nr:hypothetical protein O9K51_05799 [Purpureocillium lavendulum]
MPSAKNNGKKARRLGKAAAEASTNMTATAAKQTPRSETLPGSVSAMVSAAKGTMSPADTLKAVCREHAAQDPLAEAATATTTTSKLPVAHCVAETIDALHSSFSVEYSTRGRLLSVGKEIWRLYETDSTRDVLYTHRRAMHSFLALHARWMSAVRHAFVNAAEPVTRSTELHLLQELHRELALWMSVLLYSPVVSSTAE